MPSLCRGMRLVWSNRQCDRETTNGTSEPTCMPGWKHSSSGPGILPTRTEERKRKRPCFRISSRVRRSTANHAHTIRSCCKKEVNKLVRDPCAIASNGARYGLHSPVTSEHLNGEVSAVGVSLNQVTTYSRHGHSARHCACWVSISLCTLSHYYWSFEDSRTGDVGIAAALGGIDVGDRWGVPS